MSQPSASSSIAQRRTASGRRPSATAASSTPVRWAHAVTCPMATPTSRRGCRTRLTRRGGAVSRTGVVAVIAGHFSTRRLAPTVRSGFDARGSGHHPPRRIRSSRAAAESRGRRRHRAWAPAVAPRAPDPALGRGLPQGRGAPALDGARGGDRPGHRDREAAAGPCPSSAQAGGRRRPARLRAGLAGPRALVALRRPQRPHRAAQRLVSDRASAADGPSDGRLRALRGTVLPPSGARRGLDPRALPGPARRFRARPRGHVQALGEGLMNATPARPRRRGLAARGYAVIVVGLRHVIPLAWIAAAVAATVALPGLGDAPAAPLDDLAAKGGSAANAQALATRTFGFPLATDTAVVQRDPRGLSQDAQRRQLDAALAVRDRRDPALEPLPPAPPRGSRVRRAPALEPLQAAIPLSNANVRTPSGERGTTAITYLLFRPDASLDDERAAAQHYAQRTLGGPRAAVVGVTGAAPAREAQFHQIEQALPLIEAASVVLIALIVALAFRSIGAPLVALAAAGIAYTITMRVLPWLGERANVTVPKEIEPVVVVLLLGLVTDYSIFFLSETRLRLRAGDERLPAARAAVAQVAPIVMTAGLIVAAGTPPLVVGHLEFFRAFGPGLAATTLITLAVSVTLVPALVALF